VSRATLLVPALALSAAAVSCGSSAPQGFQGATFPHPYAVSAVPATTLAATDGRPFDLKARLAGRTTLLYFGYTHCPDVCPTVVADEAAALRHLPAKLRDATQVLFVTSDPGRDTVPVLKDYLARFDSSFIGLTGTLPQIQALATALGDDVEVPKVVDGDYEVGHGAQVLGFGPGGTAPVAWLPGDQDQMVRQLEHDVPLLVSGHTT